MFEDATPKLPDGGVADPSTTPQPQHPGSVHLDPAATVMPAKKFRKFAKIAMGDIVRWKEADSKKYEKLKKNKILVWRKASSTAPGSSHVPDAMNRRRPGGCN